MVSASLPKCISLSSAGSVFNVIAVALLAYLRAQKKNGNEWSKCAKSMVLALSIVFTLLNAAASVSSSWFGPVSISVPTSHGTNMLVSMIVFGLVLKLEDIDKYKSGGTLLAALAVMLLPLVGPKAQNYQDLSALLFNPYSLLWIAILFLGMVVSIIGLAYSTKKKHESLMFFFNLITQCTSGVLATTFAKMIDLAEDGVSLVITAFLCLLSGIIMLSAIVQQPKLQQGLFVPLKTAVTIIINSVTGIIIWEDWRVVSSWFGYALVLAMLVVANYLISDFDVQKWLKDCGVSMKINYSDDKLVASDKKLDAEATQDTTFSDRDDSIESEEESHQSIEIIDIRKKSRLSDDIEALEDCMHSCYQNGNAQALDYSIENHVPISIGTIEIEANVGMEDRSTFDLEEGPPNIVGSWR